VKSIDEGHDIMDNLTDDLHDMKMKLLEIEANQNEAFLDIIDEFIQNYKELDNQDMIQGFFKKIRELESNYQEQDVKPKLLQEAELLNTKDQKSTLDEEILEKVKHVRNAINAIILYGTCNKI